MTLTIVIRRTKKIGVIRFDYIFVNFRIAGTFLWILFKSKAYQIFNQLAKNPGYLRENIISFIFTLREKSPLNTK